MNPIQVVFYQVPTSEKKILRITQTVRAHFSQKERFIFFVEDAKAELFLSDLLWKSPPTSFLPHTISDEPNEAWITITKSKVNINQAEFAFNLCPTPLLLSGFKKIYDFEDTTSPSKQNLSSLRFHEYKNSLYSIQSI
jgi:DNA polymerase IIIc chi subunit